jgi:hypothetical protein
MFKRTFWFTTGATAGFGGAMWLRRRVLQTVQRYTPEHVQADVADSVKRWRRDVRAAVAEGRAAMASREAELHAELEAGPGADSPAALPAAPGDGRAVIDVAAVGDSTKGDITKGDATAGDGTGGGHTARPTRGTLRRAIGTGVTGVTAVTARRRRRRSRSSRVG